MSSQDPIESFIRSNRKFSVTLLINAHSHLGVLQMNKGGLTFEDVLQSLYNQGHTLNNIEINAHSMLILGILVPALTTKGQIKLQMPREILSTEAGYIRAILNLIYVKCANVEYPFVEEFKNESMQYLSTKNSTVPKFSEPLGLSAPGADSPRRPESEVSPNSNVRRNSTNVNPLYADCDLPDDHKAAANRIEFEKSEPIVRLLAQVRKVGMDILFPQSTHDKILACIFVAIRSSSTPAHRELIDMVMAVKESGKISQLEHVSKTKVRGVLALLKHGDLLITQGAEGEPVRLYLAPGIETYKDLREKHDVFLARYMIEHHLFIPAILKSELTWQFEEETKAQRLETLNKLVSQLQHFYTSYIAYQEKLASEAEENGVGISHTSSEDNTGPLMSSASNSASSSVMGDSEWNYVRPQSLPVQKTSKPTASEYLDNRPKSLGYNNYGPGQGQHHQAHQQQQPQQHHQQQQFGHQRYSPQPSFPSNGHGNMNMYGGGSSYLSMQQQQQRQQQQQQQQHYQQQQAPPRYSTGDLQAEYRMYTTGGGMQHGNNFRNTFQNPAFKASNMQQQQQQQFNRPSYAPPQQTQQQQQQMSYNMWQGGGGGGGGAGAGRVHQEPDYSVFHGDDLRSALPPVPPVQQNHFSGSFQPQSNGGGDFGGYGNNNYQSGMRTSFARGSVSLDPKQLSPPSLQAQQQSWSPNGNNKVIGGLSNSRPASNEFPRPVSSEISTGPLSFVGRSTPGENEFDLNNLNSFNINNTSAEDHTALQANSRRSSSHSTGSSRRSSNYSNADSRRSSRLIENVCLSGDEEENSPVVDLGDFGTDVLSEDRRDVDWSDFGVAMPTLGGPSNRSGIRLPGKLGLKGIPQDNNSSELSA